MPVSMNALADDLVAESAALRELLAELDAGSWARSTPAAGWTIADQVVHLAQFDDIAVRSAAEPDAFRAEVAGRAGVDPDAMTGEYRGLSGPDLLGWFDHARTRLVGVFRELDPAVRVPWFGPAMSAASSLTGRILETWAHGQDVADALGVLRRPTDRLRHVAHIGVGARPYSFRVRNRRPPAEPVRVELAAPGGGVWTWGPEGAEDRVVGEALDFCLVVTQRRHRADTELVVVGPAADAWMSIAQAFAGPAGSGRRPGQFAGARS
jgi:uncharacterized protein (TIGR03084 family)